jgi:fibronectin type 3 domain-containing protein
MKLVKLTLLFLLIANLGFAQEQSVLTFTTVDSVFLRWQPVAISGLEGYKIYRKPVVGSTWEQINKKLIKRLVKSRDVEKALGYQSDLFYGLFKVEGQNKDITESLYLKALQDEVSQSLFGAISLINYKFGEALGVVYHDPIGDFKSYQYKIAYLVNGVETDLAISEPVTTGVAQLVPEVNEIKGKPGNEVAKITWKKELDKMKAGKLITYNVYRADNVIGPYQRINYQGILPMQVTSGNSVNDKSIQTFTDKYLNNNRAYYYQVRGINAFGFESIGSSTLELTPVDNRTPKAPIGVEVSVFGTGTRITWNSDPSAHGYALLRSLKQSGPYSQIYPLSDILLVKGNSWVDVNGTKGRTYYYFVKAIAMDGVTSSSSDTIMFDHVDLSPPNAPSNVLATIDKGKITISWDKSTQDRVMGYEIERASDKRFKTRFSLNSDLIEGVNYVDDPPDNSQTTYGYVVYAVSNVGIRSEASKMVKARLPDKIAPQTPFITFLKQTESQVQVRWTENIEDDLATYTIYRSTEQNKGFVNVAELGTNQHLDLPPSDGIYFYQVDAVDSTGNRSKPSQPVSTRYTKDKYPQPPTAGSVTEIEGKLVLKWTASSSQNIDGYLVKRKSLKNNRFIILQETSSEGLEVTDRYALVSESFQYEVIAFNKEGRESKPLTVIYLGKKKKR